MQKGRGERKGGGEQRTRHGDGGLRECGCCVQGEDEMLMRAVVRVVVAQMLKGTGVSECPYACWEGGYVLDDDCEL